jgi:hypothetical protein
MNGTAGTVATRPILEMYPHGCVVCVVSFVKKKPVVLAREHEIIKLIVQHGTPVQVKTLTKEQEQKKAYSSYSTGGNRKSYGRSSSSSSSSSSGSYGRRNDAGAGHNRNTNGYNTGQPSSLSFNLDELIAIVNKSSSTKKYLEKDIRRTLDKLRYQGEITTTWEGRALRARMTSAVPTETTLIDNVATDLYAIANRLALSSVSKVEGMYKLATRAAVTFAPKLEPSTKLHMSSTTGNSATTTSTATNELNEMVPLLNAGLEKYFQDKKFNETVDDTDIAAVVETKQSDYEIARLKRIAKNNEELVRLGLMSAADALKNLTAATSCGSGVAGGDQGGEQGGEQGGNHEIPQDQANALSTDGATEDQEPVVLSEILLPFSVIDASAAALLRSDVCVLLQNQLLVNNSSTTPRAITRIFHGIGSPAFPSPDFWNTTFWNRHRKYQFNALLEFVTKTMREMKLNQRRR